MSKVTEAVSRLAKPVAQEEGLELVDVTFTKEGNRFFLRVFIDKPGGIGIDDCERLSNKLTTILDAHDPISQSYYLEVSSPGLDRPLKRDTDFERFQGRQVTIHTFAPVEGQRRLTGILLGLIDDEVQLDLGKDKIMSIPRNNISRARLVPEVNWEGLK